MGSRSAAAEHGHEAGQGDEREFSRPTRSQMRSQVVPADKAALRSARKEASLSLRRRRGRVSLGDVSRARAGANLFSLMDRSLDAL